MAGLRLMCVFLIAPVILAKDYDDEVCVAKIKCDKYPKTCKDVKDDHMHEYRHVMMDDGMEMLCDTHTDMGGWTVIQRRTKGDLDFYRKWDEYKYGFGDMTGDFWYGLERIHKLTSKSVYELYITFDYNGKNYYAKYDHFGVMSEKENYKLQVWGYSGTAGDSLKSHDGGMFSTKDKDNDKESGKNCAQDYHGGWWYVKCHHVNLNGLWNSKTFGKGLNWKATTTYTGSATNVVIRIRQVFGGKPKCDS